MTLFNTRMKLLGFSAGRGHKVGEPSGKCVWRGWTGEEAKWESGMEREQAGPLQE